MLRKVCLLPLLVVWSGCDGQADLGGDAGGCDDASVEAGRAEAADATRVEASDAAYGEAHALEAGLDALVGDAAGDGSPVADDGASVADAPTEAPATVADGGHCTNGKQDFDESDVDCGGSCSPCGPRKVCFVDADCSPTASGCDADAGGCYCVARQLVCVYNHCFDRKKDVDETDLDCGGRTCAPCAAGLACQVNSDCVSNACDALSDVCVYGQCGDHKLDGAESDIDCGGACGACLVGQRCNSNFDCQSGHLCQGDAGIQVCR